jgi:beta-xylosidase
LFKGKLYRLEWHRPHDFMTGQGDLRIMDHAAQREVSHFGKKHRFPCAIVDGDTVYVIGMKETHGWCGDTLTVFTSKDLLHWEEHEGFRDPRFRLCNTSVCKTPEGYLMSIEIVQGSPGGIGYFSGRFLQSKDLLHWTLMPEECRRHLGGTAISPHCVRYANGWYYLFSTVGGYPTGWVLLLDRSRDLKVWEASPLNPVMKADANDKLIANPKLTTAQRDKIAKALDRDNSDIDFCEFGGKLIINYCWGDQIGHEFIAEAGYASSETQFLEACFPASGAKTTK